MPTARTPGAQTLALPDLSTGTCSGREREQLCACTASHRVCSLCLRQYICYTHGLQVRGCPSTAVIVLQVRNCSRCCIPKRHRITQFPEQCAESIFLGHDHMKGSYSHFSGQFPVQTSARCSVRPIAASRRRLQVAEAPGVPRGRCSRFSCKYTGNANRNPVTLLASRRRASSR